MAMNEWTQYLDALKGDFTKLARLDFLQPDGTVAFSIDNNPLNRRRGAFIQDGSTTVNLQNGKRRTASVLLANADGEYEYNVNKLWFGQQIRVMEGMILPGGREYYLPQGVYYAVDPEETMSPKKKTAALNLQDKWAYLDGTLFGHLDGIYEIPVGTHIFTAVQSVLDRPRGNGQKVDCVKPLFTDYYNGQTTILPNGTEISDLLLPYTYRCESDEGTYADILLEMNKIIAGWIGYDQTGRLRIDPSQDDILDATKPIQWNFTPDEKQFMGATYTVKNTDVFNDVIITGEGLDQYANVSGRAVNLDPGSDTNARLIGHKIRRESQPGFATMKQCEALAEFRLKRQTILQKSVTIKSSQMFHLYENQIVTIARPDKKGYPIERHLVTGFTRPLSQNGEMTIQATSVQDFPIATIVRPLMPGDTLYPSNSLYPSDGKLENVL